MWFVSVAFQEGKRGPHFCRAGKPPAPFSRFPLLGHGTEQLCLCKHSSHHGRGSIAGHRPTPVDSLAMVVVGRHGCHSTCPGGCVWPCASQGTDCLHSLFSRAGMDQC